ncbi:hypothetical protein RR46_07580 [Papilio xuthus]|uniref:Kazal-like domain-containing protein n=1 Tax=Papilio xuthus TaxID=66420 RepID=A0A194QBD4_PAPXU|nr:hypothetical protein RR46_07580 [Papilio xuthus]
MFGNLVLSIIFFAMYLTDADDSSCVCSTLFSPVCATNGRTYSNRCRYASIGSHRTHLTHRLNGFILSLDAGGADN